MKKIRIDYGLDTLLDLNGTVMVIDPSGQHWVKFIVNRVPKSPERPHGLNYSLTLHTANGERLVGFDNAHSIAKKTKNDHKHRLHSTKSYEYSDATALLVDFWNEVEITLKQKGVTL